MKLLILSTLAALACADVSHLKTGEENAKIVSQDLDVGVEGEYRWSFETDNGIRAKANGLLNNPNSEAASQVSQGAAEWTAPDGQAVSLQYVADENGYQPQGSHIPTPPPIPAAIIRALEYIQAHPPPPEKN